MKSRIGIDMRMAGEGFGIGQYITNLVLGLLQRPYPGFEYVLFFDRSFSFRSYEKFSKFTSNCVLVDIPYYSIQEQARLPSFLKSQHLDLVHFPNFNAPIAYPGRYVITIHDLIHHHFPGKKFTHLPHRLAYRTIISLACRRARQVIAVSRTSKSDILSVLKVRAEKVTVVHEGVSKEYFDHLPKKSIEDVKQTYGIQKDYALAVGVWRQYKNLPFLSRAFTEAVIEGMPYQLVLVGEEDPNYPGVREQIFRNDQAGDIVATGKISADDLRAIYQGAQCFVSASLFEGFGLPLLEAQASLTPVVSSDIPVAREILGNTAIFFNPQDNAACKSALIQALNDDKLRQSLISLGVSNARNYTWQKCARKTERVYELALQKNQ